MKKKTKIFVIDKNNINNELIKKASNILKKGGLVSFPTETVYGLGANALDKGAVKKIFKAKKRPADNPLIVHVANKKEINKLAEKIDEKTIKLINKFWPGPLTILLKKKKIVPDITTAGLDNVAIRMPNNKIALSLIKKSGVPIAAPSANSFSRPSPTTAEHVVFDLDGKIEVLIDGGDCDVGVESSVIDMTQKIPVLLRPGGVSFEELKKVLGKVKVHPLIKDKKMKNIIPFSPGMKYKHYAPDAELLLIKGTKKSVNKKIKELFLKYNKQKKSVGIITYDKDNDYTADSVRFIGSEQEEIAKNLFKCFRDFNNQKIEIILAESLKTSGLGLAIMNRLKKACTRIIKV